MKKLSITLTVLAYVLALPFLLVWAVIRLVRYVRVLCRAVTPALTCGHCRQETPLVGIWQCQCGYTYPGHLLCLCPICHRVPRVARCIHCGVTTKLI
jgi:hypothetical protein